MQEEVLPHDERRQEQGYVDREVWTKAGANGFLCCSMREEYGGGGADRLYSVVPMEEQARANNSSLGWGLHSEIVAPYLLRYGSDALFTITPMPAGDSGANLNNGIPQHGPAPQNATGPAVLRGTCAKEVPIFFL